MKIRVSSGQYHFNLRLPGPGRFSLWLAGRALRDADFRNVPPETAAAVAAELRRIRKCRGPWELVEVASKDVSIVSITL